MMNALREQASGWVVKILLGLLVLSFAAWGIGDIFKSGGRDVTLAKVGDIRISRGVFEMEYQRKTNELRAMLGDSFSPEMLKSLKMDVQVLNMLVDQALVKKEADRLGVIVGDSEIQDAIRKNPDFKGPTGKFDLRTFQTVLDNNHTNEKHYYNSLRSQMSAEILLGTLSQQKLYPSVMTDSLVAHALERRSVDVLVIPSDTKIVVAAPSEEDVKKYYDAHKNNFTFLEMREGKYIDIRFEELLKSTIVPSEDIAKAYKERIEDYKRPETREVSQLLYDNEESAQKAYKVFEASPAPNVQSVASAVAPLNKDKMDLGFVKKSDMPSEAADIVFSLKQGEYTKPISSDFGWHIFQLKSIKPEDIAPLSEVQPLIEKNLKQHTVEESIYATVNKLEDALAAGSSFEIAAKDMGLSVKSIPRINKNGQDDSGKKPEGLPAYSNFVSTLFNTDEKNQSAMTIADDGSYFVIETTKVTPERIKALDEVKSEVTAALEKQQKQTALLTKADTLAVDMKSTSVSEAIQKSGLNVRKVNAGTLTRASVESGADASAKLALPKALVEELFTLQTGKNTSAIKSADGGYMIGILKTISPATAQQIKDAGAERASVESGISKDYQNELYEQYMRYLRAKYEVVMYQDRLSNPSSITAGNEQ
jgi:peptidyl-prolyl cis-trans isomerase D